VIGLLLAPVVRAQTGQWNPYSTIVYREGPGVRLGTTPLVLHPGLAVEGGYDSNVFYMPDNPVGAGLLRIRAHFDLATLPPQRLEDGSTVTAEPKVDFRLSTQFEYREYLTSNPTIESQRSVNVYLVGDLGILPMGPFTLRLNETFVHTVDPPNLQTLPTGQMEVAAYTRNYNRAGFLATYRTPAGRFEVGLGDRVEVVLWDNAFLATLGNTVNNEADAFFRVRFLPQTVGSINLRVGYTDYFHQPALESIPVRAIVGFSSLITSWLSGSASLGYGGSFHRATGITSFNSAVANLEARFFVPKGSRLSLGYDRDFSDSLLAIWYTDDRLYVAFDQPFLKRLSAHLDAGVRFRHYNGVLDPMTVGYADYTVDGMSTRNRDDLIYDVHAELSVRATSWLGFAASYNLIADSTKFTFVSMTGQNFSARYIKHSAFLRADFAY
jgi:hypothetical protein